MNSRLVIIILAGIITGMVLSVPTLFMSDTLVGGLIVGFLAGVIGYFTDRHSKKEAI